MERVAYIPSQRWRLCKSPHGITTQKTNIDTFIAVRTANSMQPNIRLSKPSIRRQLEKSIEFRKLPDSGTCYFFYFRISFCLVSPEQTSIDFKKLLEVSNDRMNLQSHTSVSDLGLTSSLFHNIYQRSPLCHPGQPDLIRSSVYLKLHTARSFDIR
jgi:hypothetical protein